MALETRVVLFVGGVGGAKLAVGLSAILPPEQLTIIANTGDDFWHYGLRVCPDMDTLLYTLSGRVDPVNGWGLENDTTVTLEALRALGETPWFALRDRDIATHLLRTEMLRQGARLTEVVQHLAHSMGIAPRILPMADMPVETKVQTREYGELDFQEYFVRYRWQPTMTGIRYAGSEAAEITPEIAMAIAEATCILIAPSNPWLSIAPVLQIPGMRALLMARPVPRIAISPIVGGQAIKGPTAKLMTELGYTADPLAVARWYGTLLTGYVYDTQDAPLMFDIPAVALETVMHTREDKIRLATQVLAWVEQGALA